MLAGARDSVAFGQKRSARMPHVRSNTSGKTSMAMSQRTPSHCPAIFSSSPIIACCSGRVAVVELQRVGPAGEVRVAAVGEQQRRRFSFVRDSSCAGRAPGHSRCRGQSSPDARRPRGDPAPCGSGRSRASASVRVFAAAGADAPAPHRRRDRDGRCSPVMAKPEPAMSSSRDPAACPGIPCAIRRCCVTRAAPPDRSARRSGTRSSRSRSAPGGPARRRECRRAWPAGQARATARSARRAC